MPTKAFETTPDLEFDFFLAEKLGMLVADLRERVSGQEYRQWHTYYSRQKQRRELAMSKGR